MTEDIHHVKVKTGHVQTSEIKEKYNHVTPNIQEVN
jgi:hypothetical protein